MLKQHQVKNQKNPKKKKNQKKNKRSNDEDVHTEDA